jgi:DNA-binding beta-propeller fold protein YncE
MLMIIRSLRQRSLHLSLGFCLWGAAGSAFADPYLYVGNSGSSDITVISIPGHEVVSRFAVGHEVDDVIGSHDGKMLFASLKVVKDHPLGYPTAGEIVAVDTQTEKVKWRVAIDIGIPNHLSIDKNGMLYVPMFDRPYVYVVDTHQGKIVDELGGALGMHGTRLSPDEKRLYVGAIFHEYLGIHNLATKKPEKFIWFEDGVRPFAFTRDEKIAYVQESKLHGFRVVDLQAGKILRTVDMPALPANIKPKPPFWTSVNHGLELSPDEKYIVANASIADFIAIYSHPDLKHLKTIPVGDDPNWVVFSPDSKYAYISNRGSGEVSVISMDEMREIKRVDTQGEGSARMSIIDVPVRKAN